jgi:dolichol-phosphate mannosyltransferase
MKWVLSAMSNYNELCIFLPTLNENSNIRILIPEIRAQFKNAMILVVDDASTDGTREFLQFFMQQDKNMRIILRNQRLGIGSAHILALHESRNLGFKYLLTMDADLTHTVSDALRIINKISNYDLVIGSRYLNDSNIHNWTLFRKALTFFGHFATKFFFSSNLDMSSGLRAYNLENLPLSYIDVNCPDNYEYFFTSVLIFMKCKLRIFQVGVSLNPRESGASKMSLRLMFTGVSKLFLYGLRIKRLNLE